MTPDELHAKRDEFKALSSAFLPTSIVLSAIELGVFSALGGVGATAAVLAQRLALSPRPLEILLEGLVSLGFIVRRDDASSGERPVVEYENSAMAARHLVEGARDYEGDSALMSLWFMRLAGGLSDVIRSGEPHQTMEAAVLSSPRHGALVARAMDQIAQDFTQALREHIDMTDVARVLDVGGAAGTYANALIEDHPLASATVLELPNVAAEARRIGEERGWSSRVRVVEGDFRTADLGGPYSIVLASNVFHLLDRAAAATLVERAARALAPGGRLVIKEMLGRAGGAASCEGVPPALAPYAILMLLISNGGELHDEESYASWCTTAGLRRPRRVDCWTRSSLLIAHKTGPIL